MFIRAVEGGSTMVGGESWGLFGALSMDGEGDEGSAYMARLP